MTKKSLQELKDQAERLRAEIYNLEKKELTEKMLPEANKLIGQCYKYRNSYGGDKEDWWIYQKVVAINTVSDENRVWLVVNEFQKDCNGDINFRKKTHGIRDLRGDSYQKISSKQYEAEKMKLVKILQNL